MNTKVMLKLQRMLKGGEGNDRRGDDEGKQKLKYKIKISDDYF